MPLVLCPIWVRGLFRLYKNRIVSIGPYVLALAIPIPVHRAGPPTVGHPRLLAGVFIGTGKEKGLRLVLTRGLPIGQAAGHRVRVRVAQVVEETFVAPFIAAMSTWI